MSEHYDFHYQPTGSGAISGQQVLEQTEDAINELGDYVNDNVGGAMDVAQQALETAQNAEQDAQTALDTANSFSSAIQSAQQDASTALSTAQTAQTTASNANNMAIQAQQDANTAVTTANNASGQVSTLSGTVTTLGQRVTTAEGNIGQNTSDITALTTRVGTAEGNITTLQNDVSIAQGNASSAMATAGQVKQQAYVFRYSSTALVASSTNSNALLDNTDNLKVGDKVIDSSGVLFSITAIDTANSTFTIGTALVDLATDSDVVHKSGNETISGSKTFSDTIVLQGTTTPTVKTISNIIQDSTSGNETISRVVRDKTNTHDVLSESVNKFSGRNVDYRLYITAINNDTEYSAGVRLIADPLNTTKSFTSSGNNTVTLGSSENRWRSVYANNYYYGNDNVEFSTKFVTTDTSQTISGNKTFSSNVNVYNSDSTANTPNLYLRSSKIEVSSQGNTSGNQNLVFLDKNNTDYAYIKGAIQSNGGAVKIRAIAKNSSDNSVINELQMLAYTNGNKAIFPSYSNEIDLGISNYKWKSFNGLEPSSLGMPDLSNGVDISSYITHLDKVVNSYTPPANGWLSIRVKKTSLVHTSLMIYQTGGLLSSCEADEYNISGTNLPVIANQNVEIYIYADALVEAKFFPCQGNV